MSVQILLRRQKNKGILWLGYHRYPSNSPQVYTTQEGKEEIKINPRVYTTREGMQEIRNNPQVYTTQEGKEEIKINPPVYTTREGMQEIRNNPQVYTTQEVYPYIISGIQVHTQITPRDSDPRITGVVFSSWNARLGEVLITTCTFNL